MAVRTKRSDGRGLLGWAWSRRGTRLLPPLGVLAALLVASVVPGAGPLGAQSSSTTTAPPSGPVARIELAGQTPVAPLGGDVTFRLALSNPPPDASVIFSIYPAISTRSEYERAVGDGPLGSVLDRSGVVSAPLDSIPVDVTGTRTFTIGLQSPTEARDPERVLVRRAGVYPVVVELRNGSDVGVANFRSALVVSEADRPTVNTPLEVAWVWPVSAPPSFLPSGEADKNVVAALRPEGRLGRQMAAVHNAPDIPITLAPTAETVDAWAALGNDDSSIQAGSDTLRSGGPNRHVLDGTYVPLDLAALLDHGLSQAVDENVARGEQLLTNVYTDQLDTRTRLLTRASNAALARLVASGVDHVVLDTAALAAPASEPNLTPARPVTARYATLGGAGTVAALVPEPSIQGFLTSDRSAALRAQLVLADLAVIANEAPSVPRVITILNPADLDAPAALYSALFDGLRGNPYVRPVTVAEAFSTVPPETTPSGAAVERDIAAGPVAEAPVSSSAYENERERLGAFGALTHLGDPAVSQADRSLLASVSSAWPADAGKTRAAAHLRVVDRSIKQFMSQIEVPDPRTITLTSRAGEIPLTFRNGTGYPVHLRASLSSEKLFFPEGTVVDLELPPRSVTVRVAVETRTSGTFPLELEVTSSDGVLPISQRRLEVRSTFVSTVGIVLMASAALFLAGWWGLDLRRRRRRRAHPDTP